MTLNQKSKKRVLARHGSSASKKRPQATMAVEAGTGMRKWEGMPHDVLVTIMKCLAQRLVYVSLCKPVLFVCRSWMLALLDSMFPSGDVLDLRFLVDLSREQRLSYLPYLSIVLSRPHHYSKIYIPQCYLGRAYHPIAQRLPELKCFVAPRKDDSSFVEHMASFWPKLEEAHFNVWMLPYLNHCRFICRLNLWGRIGDDRASVIANEFPLLVHLEIQTCILSKNALSIILDGQKNLNHLDTRHAFCVEDAYYMGLIQEKLIEWDESEIRPKVAGVKSYLHCARKHCSYCAPLYSLLSTRDDLLRFHTI